LKKNRTHKEELNRRTDGEKARRKAAQNFCLGKKVSHRGGWRLATFRLGVNSKKRKERQTNKSKGGKRTEGKLKKRKQSAGQRASGTKNRKSVISEKGESNTYGKGKARAGLEGRQKLKLVFADTGLKVI